MRTLLTDEEWIALSLPSLSLLHEVFDLLVIKQESLMMVAMQSMRSLKVLALLLALFFGLNMQALCIDI